MDDWSWALELIWEIADLSLSLAEWAVCDNRR